MEAVPHRKPYRNIGMRFSFIHMAGSHEVVAEEDVGLDSLYHVISVLGGDSDL